MSKLKRYIQRRGANTGASLAAITPADPGEWCPAPPLCSTMRTRMTKIIKLGDYPQDCPPQGCPLGGNPEVGNSEYISHQDCPPQLLSFIWIVCAWYGPWVSAGDMASVFDHRILYILKNKTLHAIWRDIWKRTVEKGKKMQPMWQCILSGRPFEDSLENTQWNICFLVNILINQYYTRQRSQVCSGWVIYFIPSVKKAKIWGSLVKNH